MSHQQNTKPPISVREWRQGDEDNIIDFLNSAYLGGWGNTAQWEWRYPRDPSFASSNIFIIERDDQIVGHRGFHPRQLVIQKKKIPVVFLGDTAISHNYQELGLYSSLHSATLEAAGNKGACLALTQNSRGSVTYRHNKKTGFVVIKQNSTYIKPINHTRVFQEEVSTFISRRKDLRHLLGSLETALAIQFDETVFSLRELLNDDSQTASPNKKKNAVRIILVKDSLTLLIRFAIGGRFEKVKCLALLVLHRKAKIKMRAKVSSLATLGRIVFAGIRMLKYV